MSDEAQGRIGDFFSRQRAVLQLTQGLFEHAIGQCADNVVVGPRPGPGVALFEEHPLVLFVAWLGDANQFPQSREFFAMEFENEFSLVKAVPRVPDGFPSAAVPDDDGAGAVLFRRNGPFKAAVVERVVFDMHRHTFLGRIATRAFWHGPAQQNPIELEAQIVVKAARPVLLNHISQLIARAP